MRRRAIEWTLAAFASLAAASGAGAQQPLTLGRARELALDRSPALRQAEARARSDGAARLESWGRLLPSVRISAGFDRSGVLQRTAEDPITGGIVALPDSLIQERTSFGTNAMLALDWTLFDGGQGWLEVRRSGALADAADLRLAAARATNDANVTIAWLDALEAESQLELREAEANRARTLLDAAQARFRTGAVPEIDVLQASLALNEAELALEDAHIEVAATRASLGAYIGTLPDAVTLEAPAPVAPPRRPLDELAACVLDASPDLAALRAELEAAERSRSAARWSLLPTVGVGATLVRSEFGQSRDAVTLDPRNAQAFYSLNLSWRPLEQPGGWLAERQRAAAGVDQAAAALAAREASMRGDVERAVGSIRRALIAQERGELNLRLAGRQREQAAERYRLGLAPITETIQAESLARAAEGQAVAARFALLRALAGLQLAAGLDPRECDG